MARGRPPELGSLATSLLYLPAVKEQEGHSMTQGTIKTIRDDKGFGFIKPENGTQDLFFHRSAVEANGFDQLREGDRVEFTAGTDPRNPSRSRAEQVRPIGDAPLAEALAAYTPTTDQN
jgi:CspA family cold shock protein